MARSDLKHLAAAMQGHPFATEKPRFIGYAKDRPEERWTAVIAFSKALDREIFMGGDRMREIVRPFMEVSAPEAAEPAQTDEPLLIIFPPESTLQRIRGKRRRPQYLDLRNYPGLGVGSEIFATS